MSRILPLQVILDSLYLLVIGVRNLGPVMTNPYKLFHPENLGPCGVAFHPLITSKTEGKSVAI